MNHAAAYYAAAPSAAVTVTAGMMPRMGPTRAAGRPSRLTQGRGRRADWLSENRERVGNVNTSIVTALVKAGRELEFECEQRRVDNLTVKPRARARLASEGERRGRAAAAGPAGPGPP